MYSINFQIYKFYSTFLNYFHAIGMTSCRFLFISRITSTINQDFQTRFHSLFLRLIFERERESHPGETKRIFSSQSRACYSNRSIRDHARLKQRLMHLQFLRWELPVPEFTEFTFCLWMKSNDLTHSHPIFSYSSKWKPPGRLSRRLLSARRVASLRNQESSHENYFHRSENQWLVPARSHFIRLPRTEAAFTLRRRRSG